MRRPGPGPAVRFTATLFRYPGPGGWHFAPVPAPLAPPVTERWGRTPVLATVDGQSWETSVWRDAAHGALLAVPKRVRGAKAAGDTVEVELAPRTPGASRRAVPSRRRRTAS